MNSNNKDLNDFLDIVKIIGIIFSAIGTGIIFIQYVNVYVNSVFYSIDIMMFDINFVNLLYSFLVGTIMCGPFIISVIILSRKQYLKNNETKTNLIHYARTKAFMLNILYTILLLLGTMSRMSTLNIVLTIILNSIVFYLIAYLTSFIYVKLFFKKTNENAMEDLKFLNDSLTDIKNNKGKVVYVVSFIILIIFIICITVIMLALVKFLTLYFKVDKNYYVTLYDKKNYVVISQNINNVIAVKCSIDIDKNEVKIYNGQYKIIKSNNLTIRKMEFKSVKYK